MSADPVPCPVLGFCQSVLPVQPPDPQPSTHLHPVHEVLGGDEPGVRLAGGILCRGGGWVAARRGGAQIGADSSRQWALAMGCREA